MLFVSYFQIFSLIWFSITYAAPPVTASRNRILNMDILSTLELALFVTTHRWHVPPLQCQQSYLSPRILCTYNEIFPSAQASSKILMMAYFYHLGSQPDFFMVTFTSSSLQLNFSCNDGHNIQSQWVKPDTECDERNV